MNKYHKLGYSLFGGGGALGSMLISRGCLGRCSGCYSCLALPGLIVVLALFKSSQPGNKGGKHGLAKGDH